ncbi:vacuolar protein sorting-associated protein 33B [Sabethes cyaneus]|uniref:vacuolar protein sorting-associated protein 33B n=1 Tax=Sabethes cyaneus TaxID=53552 RepID=UPI00221E30DC|nr:vacuolar protein sorting-associated protein 33B [Sabethes cyaneus]XP_053697849.1 vacuolar protein sorting-associated protein 33B [Sabethes cyaneus]
MDSMLSKKLYGFRQIAQEKLQHILYSIPLEKDLVIEPALIKPLEHIVGASWLKKKGIDKIYKFDPKNAPPKRKQFLYLLTSDLLVFKNALDQINSYQSQTSTSLLVAEADKGNKQYHVVVFPLVLASFEQLLEEEGLYGSVELYSFQWDFIVFDQGLLSLELPNVFPDVFVRQDCSLLGSIAQSLRIFQMVMGRPNLVFSLGGNAEKIVQMMQTIEGDRKEKSGETKENPDFSVMLIVDRDRDYPSCLLTPVVYAGLLLEIHKFNSGSLTVDTTGNKIQSGKLAFLQNDSGTKSKQQTTHLTMNGTHDLIYQENRYRHFSEVIGLLSSQAKALGLEGKIYSKDMKLSEMKDYVTNKLPKVAAQKKELFKHLLLCETIVEEIGANFEKLQLIEESILTNTNRKQILTYIDEQLAADAHKYNTLRLICLYHVTVGLTSEDITKLMTAYLNAFGYPLLTVFHNLFQAKLFPDTTNLTKTKILSQISIPILKSPFQIEANKLKLLPTDPLQSSESGASSSGQTGGGTGKKQCPSYVFNGNYIPLIAQLSQIILSGNSFEDLFNRLGHLERLKLGGGKSFAPKTLRELSITSAKGDINQLLPLKTKTIFVFVVGGLSYAEIAACQLVEKLTGGKIVLASDSIQSGCDIIESIVGC